MNRYRWIDHLFTRIATLLHIGRQKKKTKHTHIKLQLFNPAKKTISIKINKVMG